MQLIGEEEGTATVEYLVITLFVTISVSAAISSLGPAVVAFFYARVAWLALPIP